MKKKRIPKAILELGDLEIAKGDMVVLVGENGSGKSTLLQALRLAAYYYDVEPQHPHKIVAASLEAKEPFNGSISHIAQSLARALDIRGTSTERSGRASIQYLKFGTTSSKLPRTW
ncbi:MAG: hypothetical protein UZ21_OP11001000281 [Microgenomates bacterium OLB22]|nr:MAG: hypothetical protein UZ21_OP11001000281 [Microgenomates bacterium OLB22]